MDSPIRPGHHRLLRPRFGGITGNTLSDRTAEGAKRNEAKSLTKTMRRHISVVAALVASLFLAGLPAAAKNQLVDDASCSRGQSTKLVRSFVRAFNREDVNRLDRLWAHEPDFEWYLVDDEREEDAEDRLTLRLYFEERVLLNDRLRLRDFRVAPGGSDFAFKVFRRSDDEREGAAGTFHGKGAARMSIPPPSLSEPLPAPTCLLVVWAMDNDTE